MKAPSKDEALLSLVYGMKELLEFPSNKENFSLNALLYGFKTGSKEQFNILLLIISKLQGHGFRFDNWETAFKIFPKIIEYQYSQERLEYLSPEEVAKETKQTNTFKDIYFLEHGGK